MSESNTSSIEEIMPEGEPLEQEEERIEEETSPVVQLPAYILNNSMTMQAIREIEQHFKQGTTAYLDGIQDYNIEIGKVKNDIHTLEKSKEKEERKLLEIQAKLSYQEHLLQRLNGDFSKQISSIVELQSEYNQMLEEVAYRKLKESKEIKLSRLHDDIEELELLLLTEELERLNLLATLEPQRSSILDLQSSLCELELEKEHFESTKIHKIAHLGFIHNHEESIEDNELVETVVIDEDDLK